MDRANTFHGIQEENGGVLRLIKVCVTVYFVLKHESSLIALECLLSLQH